MTKVINFNFFISACEDDDDDEFLTVKRKNVDVDDELPDDVDLTDLTSNFKQKKAVTKAAVAKKILKKKIVPNKKINFDEDGQVMLFKNICIIGNAKCK